MAEQDNTNRQAINRAIEISIRIGLLFFLAAWCLQIVRPFIGPVLWSVILAVAVYPTFWRMSAWLGGREKTAASLLTLVGVALLIVPIFMLGGSMTESARSLSKHLDAGMIEIPEPWPGVAQWPLVGETLEKNWQQASENLELTLNKFTPQIKAAGTYLLSAATGAGFDLLKFLLSIIIAGVLLVYGESSGHAGHALAVRLAGDRGGEYADIAEQTVRSVVRGIIGVALIQSLLIGVGYMIAGVPGAGLWALLCLLLAVVQMGILPVALPVCIYMFMTADTVTASAVLVWSLLVLPVDNILKPIFLGQGALVPMPVIFVGAIGGFLSSGIIGLFTGAIVLSLSYKLLCAWLYQGQVEGLPERSLEEESV